jgi:hypothetical protein
MWREGRWMRPPYARAVWVEPCWFRSAAGTYSSTALKQIFHNGVRNAAARAESPMKRGILDVVAANI